MSKTEQNIKKIITNTTPIIDNITDIILGFAKTTKFEAGETSRRWRNWDGRKTGKGYKVDSRTKCFVSIGRGGNIKKYKIRYDEEGNEYIKTGNFTLYS